MSNRAWVAGRTCRDGTGAPMTCDVVAVDAKVVVTQMRGLDELVGLIREIAVLVVGVRRDITRSAGLLDPRDGEVTVPGEPGVLVQGVRDRRHLAVGVVRVFGHPGLTARRRRCHGGNLGRVVPGKRGTIARPVDQRAQFPTVEVAARWPVVVESRLIA